MSIIDYGMKKKFFRPPLTNVNPKVVDYIIYLENIVCKLEAENYKLQSKYSPEKIKASLNKKNM
jgi:hypothetical protein